MIDISFDEARSDAIRALLVEKVRLEGAGRPLSRRSTWFAALSIGALVFGGGLTAASAVGWIGWPVADDDPLPGWDVVDVVPVENGRGNLVIDANGTGSSELPLPTPPSEATHVSVLVTCQTRGAIAFGTDPSNNPSISCDGDSGEESTWYDFPLADAAAIYIDAAEDTGWRVAAVFVAKRATELGLNANGETFGVYGAEGDPDLVAVLATNGREGYVFAAELAEADGSAAAQSFTSPEEALAWQEKRGNTPISIPVYLSDGETQIGEFVIGGN